MSFRSASAIALLSAALCAPFSPAAPPADPPVPDRAVWDALDIVPMPKHIGLTGTRLHMETGTVRILLGRTPCRQSRIGADWINREIGKCGGAALDIETGTSSSPENWLLVIGTAADNPAIAAAVGAGLVNVGDRNPGLRGYEIRIDRDRKRVFLVGADPIGALYACVTVGELLEGANGRIAWREAEVRDWPDFQGMILGGYGLGTTYCPEISSLLKQAANGFQTEEGEAEYLAAIEAHYDRLLRWKVPLLQYGLVWRGRRDSPPESRALLRKGIEYGRERGIGALLYAAKPFVCLKEDHPEVPDDCTHARASKYGDWIRCWDRDDLRREYARQLGQWAKEVGITDLSFHDTDTGGLDDPTGWSERCDRCRRRWGDDFTAATANKHKIFYEEIKAVYPEVRIHFTFYPYGVGVFDQATGERDLQAKYGEDPMVADLVRKFRQRYLQHWQRLQEIIPVKDCTFVLRETSPEALSVYRDITDGRGLFTWYGLLTKPWTSFMNRAPAWVGTFYRNEFDVLYPQYMGPASGYFPLLSLALREYAWNVNAPGAEPWCRDAARDMWKQAQPEGDLYAVVLPHIARNFFGRGIGDAVAQAVSCNVNPWHIFDYSYVSRYNFLKTSKLMDWQAAEAEKAVAAADNAWAQAAENEFDMPEVVLARLVFLREVLHSSLWGARIRGLEFQVRELARAQDAAGAEAATKRGFAALARADAALTRLVSERPERLKDIAIKNKKVDFWQRFMAENTLNRLPDYLASLSGAQEDIVTLTALGGVPEAVMETLVVRDFLRVLEIDTAPALDGKLDDAVWAAAYPVESFFVYRKSNVIARAHTRARLLYDSGNLYLGARSYPAPGTEVSSDDTVELFLATPGLAKDYVHFVFSAGGAVRQQYNRSQEELGSSKREPDNDWHADGLVAAVHAVPARWDLEMKLPLAAIKSTPDVGGWRLNIGRSAPESDGAEWSSIQTAGADSFHDTAHFPRLEWTDTPYAPAVEINVLDPKQSEETFADRVATVSGFGLRIDSDIVLHNVRLTAEAYDAAGKLQGRKQLDVSDPLLYRWTPADRSSIPFETLCGKGGVRLLLESDETRSERWYRFGGWQGAGGVGEVLDGVKKKIDRPGSEERETARPSFGRALVEPCYVETIQRDVSGKPLHLLAERTGTVECWIRPAWRPPLSRREYHFRTVGFFHLSGRTLPDYPTSRKYAPFCLRYLSDGDSLQFSMILDNNAGWSTECSLRNDASWEPGHWMHLACVWDAASERDDQLRIYVNGKRVSQPVRLSHPDRLKNDLDVRFDPRVPGSLQVGAFSSGCGFAPAQVDELRLSRTARYTADFDVPDAEFKPDRQTTALFHFNDGLEGAGMTEDGELYEVQAVAGVVTW